MPNTLRFFVQSKKPNGTPRGQRSVDTVVEAWDWYAYFTKTYPLDEVTIIDREEEIEASS